MAKKKKKKSGGKRATFAGVKRTSKPVVAPSANMLPSPKGAITKAEDKPEELTPEDRKVANKLFKAKAKELIARATENNKHDLLLKYDVGEFAAKVFTTKTYGDHSAEEIAKELDVHQDTVRMYHRFYCRYSREKVEKFAELKMSWSLIYPMISVEDDAKRAELEDKASKGMTRDEMREEAKAANKEANEAADADGKKRDKRGGLQDAQAFRNCKKAADDMCSKIDQYLDACTNLKNITSPDKLENLANKREEVREGLVEPRNRIDKALEA